MGCREEKSKPKIKPKPKEKQERYTLLSESMRKWVLFVVGN